MKKFKVSLCILALSLFFSGSVYSQPKPGDYNSEDGDFNAGTWSETLISGAEGVAGNLIASGATEYLFEGAVLDNVILLGSPAEGKFYYEYSTVYTGGVLTLYNNSSTPAGWYNSGDPNGAYLIDLIETTVITKKYVDPDTSDLTGEIEFDLVVLDAEFNDYPGWTASVTATYDKGRPEILPPSPESEASTHSGLLSRAVITIQAPLIGVPVDIKPGSCPNPVNVKSKGVLPVAILGTADFDVTQIDLASVRLNGIAPLRSSLEDVGTPFVPLLGNEGAEACHEIGPDGIMDLGLKFDTQQFVASLGLVNDRETISVQLTGTLQDGTQILGEDVILILKPGKNK